MPVWFAAFARVLAAGIVLLGASTALAIPLSLDLSLDGQFVETVDETRLGCVDQGDGVSAICNATGLEYGIEYNAISIDVTNLLLDIDPTVSGNLTISNLDVISHRITMAFNLPIVDILSDTYRGGSISGSLTDGLGDGATVSAPGGESVYTALINGVEVYYLLTDPFSSFVPFGSGPITAADFGTPIPSLFGGPATNSIGIILDFELTPLDTVTFTSAFTVEPVPEPGTGALLAVGLALLARRRRR